MNLNAPTQLVFILALIIAVLALIGNFVLVPFVTEFKFWFALDASTDALAEAVTALKPRGDVRGAVVDVTDRAALHRAFDEAAGHYGKLDVVFANAGISGGPGFLNQDRSRNPARAIEEIDPELVDRLIEVNYKSVFTTIQVSARHMKQGGGGAIIVTSTISTFRPEIFVGVPYVVSKAGLQQLVRQAAIEVAAHKIRVNAMAPGPFVTNIGGGRLQNPETQDFFARMTPMRRMGRPEDIQGLALFLASPASAYITGEQIVIDGGVTLGTAD
jgi:NAD(P)-dependent dehydrogenase (short-subunit alcohol dehydrogenase family)